MMPKYWAPAIDGSAHIGASVGALDAGRIVVREVVGDLVEITITGTFIDALDEPPTDGPRLEDK